MQNSVGIHWTRASVLRFMCVWMVWGTGFGISATDSDPCLSDPRAPLVLTDGANAVALQVAIMIGSSVFNLLSKYTSAESFMR